ncbi:NAD(P)-dependent oxidoreductase [Pontibacillus litoralis]|uniref:NAD(P)-binding domain-containing protein n=1 Tax=Pontibacillus litoralis JSM 072002 TaxID=1385512 RepID=A0A0A5FWV9_9BACI|nr:NAD(P)H-binding protein [Pontibacillus litoralis]KGX85301.1 hypothetical protein N784_09680 [Pontibacillus litoralis JSM 072002]
MNITIFGATGRVGHQIATLLHEQGHHVQSLVRNKQKAQNLIPFANIIHGDVTSHVDVDRAIKGADYVMSALGTDKTTTLSQAMPLIIQSMYAHQLNRIITIGTAGILNSRCEETKYRYQTAESKRKKTFAAEEHATVYQHLKQSTLDWTIICPTYLPDGGEEGGVRYERHFLPIDGERITTGDTAKFAVDTLKSHSFSKCRVGICY